jgi:DNA-binding response OmpR family regulator
MKSQKNQPKILILEDDRILSSTIYEYLKDCGYDVLQVYDGNDFLEIAYEQSCDIFLIDVNVPYKNGYEVLQELRKAKILTPTIVITGSCSIDDLEKAYMLGCDDYLKKPFELLELKYRLQTLLKRDFMKRFVDFVSINDDFDFCAETSKLYKQKNEVLLQNKELKILKTLLQKRGELVTNHELFKCAWEFNDEFSEESLRTHIKNLRKILGKTLISNIRGQGYILIEC